MPDSDLWRDLAISFQSLPTDYEFTAERQYYMEASATEPNWKVAAPVEVSAEFDALARRGASMLTPAPTGDLAIAWLEALWKEATHGPIRTTSEILGKDRSGRLTLLRGKIDRVLRASTALCRKFESAAVQAEFEHKRRNDPTNWTAFHREFEAFEGIKEIRSTPAKRIPEAFARNAIARIYGIKPEEVTRKQIAFEIANLLPFYTHIELIPSVPNPEASPPPNANDSDQAAPKPVPVATPPEETIAAQLQRLRLECNWTIEKLAGKTGFDEKTVKRHLSGRVIPRLGNLTIYQQAFSKALKREVVIDKMPPKRPHNVR